MAIYEDPKHPTPRRCAGDTRARPAPVRCRVTCPAARCETWRVPPLGAAASIRVVCRRSRSVAGRRAILRDLLEAALGAPGRGAIRGRTWHRSRTSPRRRAARRRLVYAARGIRGEDVLRGSSSRPGRTTSTSRSGAAYVAWTPSTSTYQLEWSIPSARGPSTMGDVKVECHLYDETALAEAEAHRAAREQGSVRGRAW